MKKIIKYRCDYCHKTYDEEKYVISCEEYCIAKAERHKNIQSRLKSMCPNHYIYDAKNSDDVDSFLLMKNFGYADDYEYEDFKYPCKVIIFEYLERVPYEDYYETYYNVKQLDEYIDTLISAR